VLSIDLVTEIRINNRRVLEPLSLMLADPRRLRAEPTDRIWLRILDVPEALAARRYSVDGRLVIEVVDDFGGFASGRYLLDGGPGGASCSTTTRSPDLTMSAGDLASIYLGEARLATLAWTGRVEGDAAAARLGQLMFSWHLDPWCTVGF